MKIVLTGAAGNLGRYVGHELVAAGHEVVGIDAVAARKRKPVAPRNRRRAGWRKRVRDRCTAVLRWLRIHPPAPPPVVPGPPLHPSIRLIDLDLLNAAGVLPALAGAETVIHLANHTHPLGGFPDPAFTENALMNYHVFEAARAAGVRTLVFASSIHVTSSDRGRKDPPERSGLAWLPLGSDQPASPTNPYGLSKAVGEEMLRHYVRTAGMTAVALRLPFLVHAAPPAEGWPLKHQRIDEVFAWLTYADGARLVRAVLDARLTGFHCYFAAASRPWLAGDVEELRQRFFPRVPVRAPLPLASFIDCAALQRDTGWFPRDT